MRRLGRWTLNALTVLSLLLCVASVGLWAWCRGGREVGTYAVRVDRSYGLSADPIGVVGFLQREGAGYRDPDPDDVQWVHAGFRYLRITSAGMRRWNLVLPYWWFAALGAAGPARRVVRWRLRARRVAAGVCSNCGYDLRATPDRCPECGATVATAPNQPQPPG